MPGRRILLTLAAVAAVLLTLEKVGVFELVPGANLRFHWSPLTLADGRSALAMRSDVGDIAAWMQLVVGWNGPDIGTFTASIPGGDPLAVDVQAAGPSRRHISISKAPSPPQGTPFSWRAGVPLELAHSSGEVGPLVVEDWIIYPSTQASDSATKARLRRIWTVISWVLLAISVAGVAITTWSEKEESLVMPVALVRSIVGSVEGVNATETKQLRSFLSKVLIRGATVNEALDSLAIPRKPFYMRPRFQARARRVFLDRIDAVKAELDDFGARL